MWLFRKQYEPLQPGASSQKSRGLSYGQKIWNHLQEVSLFITKVYLKYWFESPAANCAPRQDLELLCALSEYTQTLKLPRLPLQHLGVTFGICLKLLLL